MEKDKAIGHSQKEILFVELFRKESLRALLIFFLVFNVFLFLRIVLRAFGADPGNAFAAFIYLISGVILLPVFGIFPHVRDIMQGGQPTFDYPAFIALFCYNILTFLAMGVIQILCSMIKTNKQANETSQKGRPIDTKVIERSLGSQHM